MSTPIEPTRGEALRERWIDGIADLAALEALPYRTVVPVDTVPQLLARNAQRYGDTDALIYLHDATMPAGGNALHLSHAALYEQVLRAGALLRALGVQRDEPVAIIAPHMPSTQIAMWGAQLAGCAFPINYLLGASHIAQLLQVAKARVAVMLGATDRLPIHAAIREALAQAGSIEHVLEIDPDEAAPAEGSFQALVRSTAPDPSLSDDLDGETTAALYHTGGTTGLPKLLTHSHRNEVHTSWFASRFYRFDEGDCMLNGFPLFHVAGAFVYGLGALAAGGSVFIPTLQGMRNAAFVKDIWRFAAHYRITHLGCVPTVLSALLNGGPIEAERTVQLALSGGSPLPAELAARFEATFDIPVRNIFGMTECVGIVSVEPAGSPRIAGSVGLPLPFTDVVAMPASTVGTGEADTPCAPLEVGQLAIRGPHVSRGYVDRSLNGATFSDDGWLFSGDLGYVDDARRIFLTGRAKDLIIRGAHNIDPRMIEEVVQGLDDVLVCAAVGEPDAYAGELPVVFAVLRDGASASPQALLQAIAPQIPEPPAMPKRVVILDALPLTAIGKIYKPALRALAAKIKLEELIAKALPGTPCTVTCDEAGGRIRAVIDVPAGADATALQALRATLAETPVAITWNT